MTTFTPEELAELARVADAATPGPWYWRNTQDVYLFGARSRVVMAFERMGMQRAQPAFRDESNVLHPAGKENINRFPDAEHIATFDPPMVKRLLAALADAERRGAVKALREAADDLTRFPSPEWGGKAPVSGWLRDRADRIESEGDGHE